MIAPEWSRSVCQRPSEDPIESRCWGGPTRPPHCEASRRLGFATGSNDTETGSGMQSRHSCPVFSIGKIPSRIRSVGSEFVLAYDMRFTSRESRRSLDAHPCAYHVGARVAV